MKALFGIFLSLLVFIGAFGQSTDAALTTQSNVIKNETAAGGNTKTRIAAMYQAIIDSKMSRLETLTASGTDTYAVTGNSTITAYTSGLEILVKFTNGNTGAATLNVNSIGSIAIKKSVSTALSSGDIAAGQIFLLVYDGTNFQLIGGSGGVVWGAITGTLSSQADVQAALDAKYDLYPAINTFISDHILNLSDVGANVEMNVGSANNVTVPLNSSVAFPTGTQVSVIQYGAGITTIVATGGVTVNSSSGSLASPGQYSVMVLEKRGSDEWYLWNGTSGGGGGVTSVTGTSNRISSTGGTTPVIDIDAAYVGQTSITTLGTISTASIPESKLTFTDITTGNASISNHGFAPKYPNDATKFLDGTGAYSVPANWLLASGGTLTGANTVTGTTSNTLKFVFAGLGTTQTNGAGHWLSNTTAAALGAQQISPSITIEGQGWKTGTSASQSVKYTNYVLPIQGGAAAQGLFVSAASIDGGAYSTVYSARSDGYLFLNGGTAGNPYLSFGGSADLVFSRSGVSSTGLEFYFPSSSTNTYGLRLTTSSNMNWSSGTGGVLKIDPGFAPSANAGNVIYQLFSPTINMTGTSSGNVSTLVNNSVITSAKGNYTFIDHNPTVTSITGTHLAARFVSGAVLIGGTTLTTNAALDVQSTTQAFMPPRMTTTQRDAIGSPAEGMMIYDTTTHKMAYYNGTIWVEP